jgi:hypothetical protein
MNASIFAPREGAAALRLSDGADRISALHTGRCGGLAAALRETPNSLPLQSFTADWRILDTHRVGQYGPRGFEGGESSGTSTARMSTNVRQLA